MNANDWFFLQDSELLHGMSVCHSLTVIEGELAGDPLDLIMFKGTKWKIEQPEQVGRNPSLLVRNL